MSYLKTIISGQTLEVYEYEKAPPVTRRKRVAKTSNRSGLLNTPQKRYGNVKRTRRNFIRLIRTNVERAGCPAFLTLTMREVVSVETAAKCLNAFFKKVRSSYGRDIEYIGVPEFQRRGAVHYHLLVWGFSQDTIVNEGRTRYIQAIWAEGFIDIIPTDGSQKLASYLAKYMLKSSADKRLFGKRGYYISRGLERPTIQTNTPIHHFTKEILGVDNRLVKEMSYDTIYCGRCVYKLIHLEV